MRDHAELSDQIKDLHGEIAAHRIGDEKERAETKAALDRLGQSVTNGFRRIEALEDAHAALSKRVDRFLQFMDNGGKRIGALEDVCAALGRRLTHHELDGHPPSQSIGWVLGPEVRGRVAAGVMEPPPPDIEFNDGCRCHLYRTRTGDWVAALSRSNSAWLWWHAYDTFDEATAALKTQLGQ